MEAIYLQPNLKPTESKNEQRVLAERRASKSFDYLLIYVRALVTDF